MENLSSGFQTRSDTNRAVHPQKVQGLHRPEKALEIDRGPGKLLEFENSTIFPGIVLEFCKIAIETVKLSLKVIKHINSFRFFWIFVMRKENCVKISRYVEVRRARCVTVLQFSLLVVPVFINTIIKIFRC